MSSGKKEFRHLSAARLCALCAEKGTSCCSAPLEYAHLFFPLSEGERERLLPYQHLAILDNHSAEAIASGEDLLCVEEVNEKEFIFSMSKLFSSKLERIEALFPVGEKHKRLRIRADGNCIFLGDEGCLLPRSVRPWYCLLFPLWVEDGKLTYFVADACLLAASIHSALALCEKMDSSAEEAYALYYKLCEDWDIE